jgi:hypothetical protein
MMLWRLTPVLARLGVVVVLSCSAAPEWQPRE